MTISICDVHNTSNRRNEKKIRGKIMKMEKDRRMRVRIFFVTKLNFQKLANFTKKRR